MPRTKQAMVGQFFIDRLNPSTPRTIKIVGVLTDAVYICDMWGMNEQCGAWRFGVYPNGRGWQIAASVFKSMENVTEEQARRDSEERLRQSDSSWRRQYAPDREPITILP